MQTSMAALDAIVDTTNTTQRYTIREAALSNAADDDRNVGFLHWRATVGPKAGSGGSGTMATSGPSALSAGRSTKEAAGVGGGSGTGKAGTFVVDAIDVVLFSDTGRMREVYQFRRPLASERREVLSSVGGAEAAGGAKAGAPAGVPDAVMQPAECC